MDSSKIDLGRTLVGAEEHAGGRRRREEAERWAAALANGVAPMCQTPAKAQGAGPGLPDDWRACDGSMTPGGTQASSEAPVCLRLDAGDLGEVAVVLERGPAGIRVVIGLAEQHASAAAGPELEALQRALEASGIALAALRIVPHGRVGTVLAQLRARHATPGEPEGRSDEASKKAATRRLNLIG